MSATALCMFLGPPPRLFAVARLNRACRCHKLQKCSNALPAVFKSCTSTRSWSRVFDGHACRVRHHLVYDHDHDQFIDPNTTHSI